MSLLDELVSQYPSPQERFQSIAPFLRAPGTAPGGPGQNSLIDFVSAPPGRGIFGNSEVDVLGQGDPRLRSGLGVTLAQPAMHSLREIARTLGLTNVDWGGGYRNPQEQANLYASKPGVAAPPGSSYHQEGLAIDLASALQNARVAQALQQAGWNQFSPQGEPWHWSYGVTG